VPNGGTVLATDFAVSGPQISATYKYVVGGVAETAETTQGLPVYFVPEGFCVILANGDPVPNGGHQFGGGYNPPGPAWRAPKFGDAWDWAEPTIESLTSSYPASAFKIDSLDVDQLWALGSYVSPSGDSIAAIPYTPAPDPPGAGPNLCFTGRAVQIALASPGAGRADRRVPRLRTEHGERAMGRDADYASPDAFWTHGGCSGNDY
jgi:hypothetical protein